MRITPKNKQYKTPTPSPHKYRFFVFFFPHKNPPTKQAITLITIKPIFSTEAERLPFNMANANTAKNSIVSNTAINAERNRPAARSIHFLYEIPSIDCTKGFFIAYEKGSLFRTGETKLRDRQYIKMKKHISYICGLRARIECEPGGEHSTRSDRVTNIGYLLFHFSSVPLTETTLLLSL